MLGIYTTFIVILIHTSSIVLFIYLFGITEVRPINSTSYHWYNNAFVWNVYFNVVEVLTTFSFCLIHLFCIYYWQINQFKPRVFLLSYYVRTIMFNPMCQYNLYERKFTINKEYLKSMPFDFSLRKQLL